MIRVRNRHAAVLFALMTTGIAAAPAAAARDITERVRDDGGNEREVEQQWSHVGLLRARDVSPFGLLRLDLLPAHTADAEPDTWTLEVQYAYQSTYVFSRNVGQYLRTRGIGREPLRHEDASAIDALPGDAYYVDAEVGLADLIVQRRLSEYWSAYFTVPYIHYGGGILDGIIESFHDTFGFSQHGRDLVARDRFQIVYSVGGVEYTRLAGGVRSGLGDPVIGIRYSLPQPRFGWDVVVEFAAKLAVGGERPLLSTGEHDFGAQMTLQRRLGASARHAVYLNGSLVRYADGPEVPGNQTQWIPTLIAGYSFGLDRRTSLILQGYASRSVVQDSNLPELTDNKFQISAGIQSRRSNVLWSFAVTENVSNFENTPDIGLQVGIAYMPGAR